MMGTSPIEMFRHSIPQCEVTSSMNGTSNEFGQTKLTPVSCVGGTTPRCIRSVATQTTDDESRPPLSSASTGDSLCSRTVTASRNSSRSSSSYRRWFRYRIVSPIGMDQNRVTFVSFLETQIAWPGGTERMPLYGVRFG